MFNECATSAFQRQGSDRYIGHWSLLPRRATEPIAASLPRGGGGGYSNFFRIRRLGPNIYRSPQKISGISSTPKNI